MKCTACGENNVLGARFCAFCGIKLSDEAAPPASAAPVREAAPVETPVYMSSSAARATARPLIDNPYQPQRVPVVSRIPVKPIIETIAEEEARASTIKETHASAVNEASADSSGITPTEPIDPAENRPAGIEEEAACDVKRPFDPTPETASAEEPRPQRAPVLNREAAAEEPASESNPGGTRVHIKSSPKRVFVFADEDEADILPRGKSAKSSRYDEDEDEDDYIEEYDGIREFDENEEFDDIDDEYEEDEDEDEPSAGHIFVRVFSVLTVLMLVAGLLAFTYGTSIGRRLLASAGMSSSAEDYMLLADWQLQQRNLSDASDSYYNAFKLDQTNYQLALTVGTGFENAGDDARAESLYSYLITVYPLENEPYDRLMALLNQQQRTIEYEALLVYRAEHQPGYEPPVSQINLILQTPTASSESGAYAAPFTLTLSAGGAEIRYTIDGTIPTAHSKLYTGEIRLDRGSHIVRAVAVVNGMISAEWKGEFFIS